MPANTEKSPSILGVYFYAVLTALFGALLGVVYLVTFPAQAFSSQEEHQDSLPDSEGSFPAPKPGDAYSIQGPILRERTWETKRELLRTAAEQVVRLSPGELNAWLTAKFSSGAAVAPAGEEERNILIVPGVPNVAITDGGLIYLNLPATITAYGSKHEFTVSARGVIAAKDFQMESVHLNSAKLPLPNSLGAGVLKTLSQSYQSTEAYAILSEALARAESVKIADGGLVFVFP